MTEEQKQIVLDKCATEEIRKDAELLFDVLDREGIEYGPGELDLSAKVDEFNFEKYLPKEYSEILKTELKKCLKDVVLKYDIWIPQKGWAFNVDALDEDNAYPRWYTRWRNGGVDAWVVDSIIYKIDRFDLVVPYSELLFAMLQNEGYSDREGFEKCIYFFFKEAYKEYSYPYKEVERGRSYEPISRRSYCSWSKGVLANIPTIYLEFGTEAVLTYDYPQGFYKELLGSNYAEISKKRQEQYFATHPELEQRFFEIYKAKLAQPTIDKNKVVSAVNRGVDIRKALISAEKSIDERTAHKLALKAIREINPDFDRAGLYNDMSR